MELASKQYLSNVALTSIRLFAPTVRNYSQITNTTKKHIAILIPTYKPTIATYRLIISITKLFPKVLIVVIDDCTPLNKKNTVTIAKITQLAKKNEQVIYLRTPDNALKASALNYGISYLQNIQKKPHVVFTFDDDIKITKDTLPVMVQSLFSQENIGAVCSQVQVKNKNKNMLTRLQALEYHSFNITKIADNGLLYGPLVMQGMLTAFRMEALLQVKGFTPGHLIEDYDITARLKRAGWQVKSAHRAVAWTIVPETVESLWRQRVRWTYGGIRVLQEFWKKPLVIYQDLLGHGLFVSLLALISFSFLLIQQHAKDTFLAFALLVVSLMNFVIAYTFNALSLIFYAQKDKKDVAIKLSVIPEFIYSNLLTLILLGSYLFSLYKLFSTIRLLRRSSGWGELAFNKVGYSSNWGTKDLTEERRLV